MPVDKTLKQRQLTTTIQDLMVKFPHNETLRNECGTLLDKFGRYYGYETANQIVAELKLDEVFQFPRICPKTKQPF